MNNVTVRDSGSGCFVFIISVIIISMIIGCSCYKHFNDNNDIIPQKFESK